MEENKVMTDEMEIGAKIIGKAVVEATKICNQITDKYGEGSKGGNFGNLLLRVEF